MSEEINSKLSIMTMGLTCIVLMEQELGLIVYMIIVLIKAHFMIISSL